MQESYASAWAEGSQLSGARLHSLRDLNRRFLELAAAGGGDWGSRGLAAIALRVAPLTPAQREAAAECPYALFDLRFRDALHWQERLRNAQPWVVADAERMIDAPIVDFVRVALFYAWHIASTAGITAQLLLGMSVDTAAMFRSSTLDSLPLLAVTEAAHLTARWSESDAYWSALVRAASRDNTAALRRVQLHGLQLAAASRLLHH
jgi:hypothetical protein